MKSRLSKKFLVFILIFSSPALFAQDKERLRKSIQGLTTTTSDTQRIKFLDNIGWDTSYNNLAVGLKYCQEALALSEKINYERGIIHACNSIGTIYQDMGDANKAISYHLRGLKLAEKRDEKFAISTACLNISLVYLSQKDYKQGLQYLLRAKNTSESLADSSGLPAIYSTLGSTYLHFPDSTQKAILVFEKALSISNIQSDMIEIGSTLGGLANCYQAMGDTVKADATMKRGMFILDSLDNDYALSQSMVNYAAMLNERGHFKEAENLLRDALVIYRKIGMVEQEKELWLGFAEIYERSGQLQKSVDAWKRYSTMKDSLMNENVLRHQREMETLYETEKKENVIASMQKDATLNKTILTSLIGGCLLLLLFLFVLYNRSQLRKKTNDQLEKQNAIIEEKNKDITDSINYARRIQEAVLPSTSVLTSQFADAFVFYRPRDIVSGDFWWCTEKNGKFLLAAADCTGHGVPGGFMSVMSAAFLSEIINEKGVTDPAEILSQLRLKVITALKQANEKNDNSSEVKDGMDISMTCFSADNKRLDLACANNPVWVISNKEVKTFPPDKFPVGIHHNELLPFTPQHDDLKSGDMVYLFSDGYADQFGGKEGKKFKYRQLKDQLVEISSMPCNQQKSEIEKRFDDWKGKNEQVDDVLLIGIRI